VGLAYLTVEFNNTSVKPEDDEIQKILFYAGEVFLYLVGRFQITCVANQMVCLPEMVSAFSRKAWPLNLCLLSRSIQHL
jgi:hypothetical protein